MSNKIHGHVHNHDRQIFKINKLFKVNFEIYKATTCIGKAVSASLC